MGPTFDEMQRARAPGVTMPRVAGPPRLQLLSLWRDPIGSLSAWSERYGDLFVVQLPACGEVVVVGEPEMAHAAVRADPTVACAGVATGRVLALLGPGCVLRKDGDAHRVRRQALSPVFHGRNLDAHRHVIAATADQALSDLPEGRPIAMLAAFRRLTFSVIAQIVLGPIDADQMSGLDRAVRSLAGPAAIVGTWLWPLGEGRVAAAARSRLAHAEAAVDRVVDDILTGACDGGAAVHRPALMGITATLPAEEIHDELRALLLVGHETTAAALGWAVERLVSTPGLSEELAASMSGQESGAMRHFAAETLAWCPAVVDAVRHLTRGMRLGPYRLPAGTLVMVSPLLAERRLREVTGRSEEGGHGRAVRGGDLVFGGGSRRCLGSELALAEMEIVLSRLLAAFTLERPSGRAERARLAGTTVVPARGARVVLRRRARAPLGDRRRHSITRSALLSPVTGRAAGREGPSPPWSHR